MKIKLVCFDLDGTLIDKVTASWQIFHRFFGIDQKIRKVTMEKFYNKEITYEQWAQSDVALWKGAGKKREDFIAALNDAGICLMPGAKEVLTALKEQGVKIAIISGSIQLLLEQVLPDYETWVDDLFISHIYFDENDNISHVDATEFDMEGKAVALKQIAKREGLDLKECAFVGDNSNDVEIAKEAGLSIAFDAKDDTLREVSDIIIDEKDLTKTLSYLI